MLAKPLTWLHDKDRKPSSYEGTVVDNNDPLKLGRVRVRVPQIHGLLGSGEFIPDEDLPWINQRPSSFLGNGTNSGMFAVPEIGNVLMIEYPTSEPYFGYYKGGVTSNTTRTTEFDEDYPNNYGFVDSTGNSFKINKTKQTFEYNHPSGNNIKINQDTSIQVFHHTGSSIIINADGSITMTTPMLNIVSPVTNISGDVNIVGTVNVQEEVIALDCISDDISGKHHIHGTAMGATSPPIG